MYARQSHWFRHHSLAGYWRVTDSHHDPTVRSGEPKKRCYLSEVWVSSEKVQVRAELYVAEHQQRRLTSLSVVDLLLLKHVSTLQTRTGSAPVRVQS